MSATGWGANRMVVWAGLVWLVAAMTASAGQKVAILLEPGASDRSTKQMADRMERDLKSVLDKRGHYSSRIIRSRDEFKTAKDEYLLAVKISRYNPGSKAARMIVGFGAGSASLDIHYDYINPEGETVLSKDDGCGTSLDWQRLARKLNEGILENIKRAPRQGTLIVAPAPAAAPAPVAVPAQVQPAVVAPVVPAAPVVAPAAPVTVSAPAAPPSDPVEQLRRLDQMKKERLISDDEYRVKRKEILSRL